MSNPIRPSKGPILEAIKSQKAFTSNPDDVFSQIRPEFEEHVAEVVAVRACGALNIETLRSHLLRHRALHPERFNSPQALINEHRNRGLDDTGRVKKVIVDAITPQLLRKFSPTELLDYEHSNRTKLPDWVQVRKDAFK